MRAILSLSILSLVSTPGLAADIVFEPAPVPPVAIVEPVFTWSGKYIGVDLGYGKGKLKEDYVTANVPDGLFNIKSMEGGFGGIYTGFGRQLKSLYFGFEGDVQYAALKGTRTLPTDTSVGRFEAQWLGSARLRAGCAMNNVFGQDLGHLLPYVTGGLAFGSFKATVENNGAEWTADRGDTGYALGAGLDYAFNHNTVAKLEYQYLDFGNRTFATDEDHVSARMKGHTFRAGVGYKF